MKSEFQPSSQSSIDLRTKDLNEIGLNDSKIKRSIDVLILSDIHLGTYGCQAKSLHKYLKSIDPKKVILNGDIIDIWMFKKSYWPKSHMKIIKIFLSWIVKGIEVTYITGNHDEMLRKFVGFRLGSFSIKNKLVFEVDQKKAWVFHGDVFDVSMKHSKWIVKLGAIGYDFLILLNTFINWTLKKLGKRTISMSKKIKDSVKSAVSYINDFEKIAADIAIDNRFDFVICGHIHKPIIKHLSTKKGNVTYMNSGDWIENKTSLELKDGTWKLYQHDENNDRIKDADSYLEEAEFTTTKLYDLMLEEFKNLEQDTTVFNFTKS